MREQETMGFCVAPLLCTPGGVPGHRGPHLEERRLRQQADQQVRQQTLLRKSAPRHSATNEDAIEVRFTTNSPSDVFPSRAADCSPAPTVCSRIFRESPSPVD